ncbi:hypothetical protein CO151_01930 [bacterium CG_4_9_14_3_um_filter_65_15]|nr:MAG: hypothetical protein CO151_01930 [bacterium CG_4_9_14_3_um_filter_65_15]
MTGSLAIGGALLIMIWPMVAAAATADGGRPDTQACLDCHEDRATSLTGGPHAVLQDGNLTDVACGSCHAGTAAHWEDDPEAYPRVNPAAENAEGTAAICIGCHQEPHVYSQAKTGPHAVAGTSCLDCHSVHGSQADHLLKAAQPELCYTCHEQVRGEIAQPYRHPVGENEFMQCSSCHLGSEGNPDVGSYRGLNTMCLKCHAEFQGPFPYEHQATVDYGTEGGGCVACHSPHGSVNPQLLKQPYEAPLFPACTQCHSVALHNNNSNHGNEWKGVSCTECHVDVHGSYTNKNFLSTALEAQGCFAAGCHSR